MTRRAFAIALTALIATYVTATAGSFGTADEARVLVDKAVNLLIVEGKAKAYPAFDDPLGPFVDRDLYIFVVDLKGTVEAHGSNKGLVGKSLFNLKDADGKPFVQDMIKLASDKGEGWVDYQWPNPLTKKVEGKSSYIKKVGDVFLGVGIYKG